MFPIEKASFQYTVFPLYSSEVSVLVRIRVPIKSDDKSNSERLTILGSGAYLSVRHLTSAARLASLADNLQQGDVQSFDLDTHQAFVIASISASCSLIEANINEIFTEAAEHDLTRLGCLGDNAIELLAGIWKRGVPSKASLTTLEKYELALDFSIHDSFDRNDPRYAEANLLMQLGATLVHYDNNWILNHGDARRCRLEREVFESKIIARFPFKASGHDHLVLGSECAKWSLGTAVGFVDHFSEMMALMPPYEDIRSEVMG